MEKDRKIKLFEAFTMDDILNDLDDVLDGKKEKPNALLYPFFKETLDNEDYESTKINLVIDFTNDHFIGNINDDSSGSEALKSVLHNKDVDIVYDDYSLLKQLYYRGINRNSIVEYIFENFIPDPNADIVHDILDMTTYSKYDNLFDYLTGREGFDPSYSKSKLLLLSIDAGKIEYVKTLLKDERIDPNVIKVSLMDNAESTKNIELLELLLKYKIVYSDEDMRLMIRTLMYIKPDMFKLFVDKASIDLSYDNNAILKKLIYFGMPNEIRYLMNKGSVMKNVDHELMGELIKKGYLPSYTKRKIKR